LKSIEVCRTGDEIEFLGESFNAMIAALASSEMRTRRIIEQSADGVVVVARSRIVRFVNPAAELLFGQQAEALVGAPFGFPAVSGETTEISIPRGVESTTVVEMRVVEIEWEGENALLASLRDITEHKRMEEKLEQSMEELARSNAELERFAYVVSHDLQEPLRMVSNYTELLGQRYTGKLDADADQFIAYAVDAAKRMYSLIDDVLAYSRVGTRSESAEPTSCEDVLKRVLADLKVVTEESGAVVTHDALPTVMADAVQLGELFQNLVGNAIKFRGQEPPRVHLSANPRGKEWTFSVRDNGIGVNSQDADRIFGVFQRLHARSDYPGNGIGLAICQKIVERHGGRIWLESESGQGSTFYFTLPSEG